MRPLRLISLTSFFLVILWCAGASARFIPENNLKIGPEVVNLNGVDETTFNNVIAAVTNVYAPIVQANGGVLNIQNLWSDSTVNSQATRQGNEWIIMAYGGLARVAAMTADGFTLVLCHEMGHHLGGPPKFSQSGGEWAAVEGEADYFSSLKCLRKVWRNDNNASIVQNMQVDPTAVQLCNKTFSDVNKNVLCKRTMMASIVVSNVLADLGNQAHPSISTPDTSRVSTTYEDHPQPQCRLDTYVNASLCTVSEDLDLSQTTVGPGSCTDRSTYGARSMCWYADNGGNPTNPTNPPTNKAPTPTLNGQLTYTTTQPNETVMFSFDVSKYPADYTYIEISQPNIPFPNPNDIKPSPTKLWGGSVRGLRGTLPLYTNRLPQKGTYYFRVIPVSAATQNAVAPFSDSSVLNYR